MGALGFFEEMVVPIRTTTTRKRKTRSV